MAVDALSPTSIDADGAPRARWYETRAGRLALTLAVLAAVLLVWWGVVKIMKLSALVLPTPYAVAEALVENTLDGSLLKHSGTTLAEIVLGFLLGSALGIVLGTVAALSPLARSMRSRASR